jgi:hypothetical protein
MSDINGLIFKAIPAIMAEIDAIGKNRKNEQQNYKFRGIDDVYNEIHPLLMKHRVFTVPKVLDEKYDTVVSAKGNNLFYSRLKIQYLFFAEDGSYVEAVVIGEGMDSGDKASNKAMAVAHKYAIIQVFAIPTEDDKDPENDSHETVAKPAVELVANTRKAGLARFSALSEYLGEEEKANIKKTTPTLNGAELEAYVARWEKKLNKVPKGAGVADEKIPL